MNDDQVTVKIKTTADTQGASEVSQALKRMEDNAGRLADRLRSVTSMVKDFGVVAATAAAAAGAAGLTIGLKFNSSVEQAEVKLMAFTKSAEKTAEVLAWAKTEAAKTQFSFVNLSDAAATLTPVANSSKKSIYDLVRQAEVLAALNPAEGLTGAAFSIREAFSSDWVSLVERFNLPRNKINELKEQGVPAMEIISRTLESMGVDYGLVSAQGQTAAARFDQIKDKLTMLAGAASKPIFDRVSKALDQISNNVDFNKWSDRAADGVENIFTKLGKMRDVAQDVIEYLAPKFAALANTIKGEFAPAIAEVAKKLGPIAGAGLVGALGLALDVLNALLKFVSDNTWIIYGLAAAFVAVKTAALLQGAVVAFQTAMTAISASAAVTTGVLGATTTGAGLLRTALMLLTASPFTITLGILGVAAVIAGIVAVGNKLDDLMNKWGDAKKKVKVNGNVEVSGNSQVGLVQQLRNAFTGFASGGYTGSGGETEVAGVVHKGEYVVPKSQVDQRTGSPMMGGGVIIQFHGPVYMRDETETKDVASQLARQLLTARSGSF